MKLVQLSLVAILVTGMAHAYDTPSIDGKITHGDSVLEAINDGDNTNGEIFGQARSFYVDRTYSGIVNNNRNSWAAGGYAGYMTPEYNGFSAAAAVYGTFSIDIHSMSPKDDFRDNGKWNSYDPSLFGLHGENYAFIGQAYLNYKYENTNFKGGRLRLDTPLAGADDARMLPNLFEAVVVSNTDIENTTLIGAHVFRETVGTFGNIYGGGALGLTSGYGLGMNRALSGKFVNMGTVALGEAGVDGKANETAGVTALAAVYSGIEGLKLQAWDYIAWDILNAVYLQADYGYQMNEEVKLFAAAQYINESDIGDMLAGSVDSNYVAGKVGVKYAGLTAYAAYSVTGDSNGAINGGVITPWGGMPAFTQGMVTRHQFFANTDTWKVAATYNFKEYGLKASVYYTNFDVGAENQYVNGTAWTASESGWDIQYKVAAVKGLSLRARANYPRDFKPGLDWDEYRLIVNYNF